MGLTGLIVTVVVVLIITLNPTPVDAGRGEELAHLLHVLHSWGLPEWFGYGKLEFTANIVMFLPLGFFVGLLIPVWRAWLGIVALSLFSVTIEAMQFVFLADRVAAVSDVIANSMGGAAGVLLSMIVSLLSAERTLEKQGYAPVESLIQ
ncbi:MAG: VanZ family protein [Arachnia sp.]